MGRRRWLGLLAALGALVACTTSPSRDASSLPSSTAAAPSSASTTSSTTTMAVGPPSTAVAPAPFIEKVGQVSTPSSVSTQAWNDRTIALAVFEQRSSDVLIQLIDRSSNRVSSVVLPDSYIVYALEFDRRDPGILWAATSQRAQLFRIDVAATSVTKVADFGADKFIFGMEPADNGDVYLGTYPDAGLIRVRAQSGRVTQLPIPPALVGDRTNVKDVLISATGLVFFHLGSPAVLIGYDPRTGRSADVLEGTDSFFLRPAADLVPAIESIDRSHSLSKQPFVAGGSVPTVLPSWARRAWALNAASDPVFTTTVDGFLLHVAHDSVSLDLEMKARHGGMPIVALSVVGDDLAIGATYWNRWMFRLNLANGQITPLGIAGDTGEFFTACPFGDRAAIPHYLGVFLLWDPRSPYRPPSLYPNGPTSQPATGREDNPSARFVVPDGHLGLACSELEPGRLVYGTLPSYKQETGFLVLTDGNSALKVTQEAQTIGRLYYDHETHRLFGVTSEFRGLGLQKLPTLPPARLVELDPKTLQVLSTTVLPDSRPKNAVGLVGVGGGRLVAATEGSGVVLIDTTTPTITVKPVGSACGRAAAMARFEHNGYVGVLLICGSQLYMLSPTTGVARKVIDLPANSGYVVAGSGGVYVAADSVLYRIGVEATAAVLADADASAPPGVALASSATVGYPAANGLTSGQDAWVGQAVPSPGEVSPDWFGLDFREGSLAASRVNIRWVTPASTPARLAVEFSDDGIEWTPITEFTSKPPPTDSSIYWEDHVSWRNASAHRYWRLRPLTPTSGPFAVEFAEFLPAASA